MIKQPNYRVSPLENKTLTWWRSHQLEIDMNPPYQRRGRLWSVSDKAYLVDSIINGFDVPKIYVADFTWGDSPLNKNRLPFAIIDGKQRFEAIFDFFSGKVVLNKDFVYAKNPSLKLGGLGYRDLVANYSDIAEAFDNFNLYVMGVTAQTEAPINELFVRLNRSKALTGAEIRNAMSGPAPKIIREIAGHEFFTDFVRFNVRRGQDLNASAKLLVFEYNSGPSETKKRNLDRFVEDLPKDGRDKLELSARQVIDGLNDMTTIFLPRDGLLGSAGILPVYYWVIRDLTEIEHPKFREFLVEFEDHRRRNRALLKIDPENPEIDKQLISYDNFNRSTDDVNSHRERCRILMERFRG